MQCGADTVGCGSVFSVRIRFGSMPWSAAILQIIWPTAQLFSFVDGMPHFCVTCRKLNSRMVPLLFFQNGTPSASTCCIADWCPFAYRCYRRLARTIVGGVRLRYADSAVFFFSGLTSGYSSRSKFYRECGLSGLSETSERKSLASDCSLKLHPI